MVTVFLMYFVMIRRNFTGYNLVVFFTLLIITAGFGRFGGPMLSQDVWAMFSDVNIPPPAAAQHNHSLLATIAPLFEPNLWPVTVLSEGQALDTNVKSVKADKNQISALAVDALCTGILSTYINKDGLVDYKTLRRKRLELISVLSEFANLDPNNYASWSEADKLAFWINAHNMCMLKAVVENYPIQPSRFKVLFYPPNSIMQLSGFWDKADYKIMGENYSLEEIGSKILRGQFDEPRLCFAISYASMGCAPLRREPYNGGSLNQQLDDQARIFLESEKGMKIDRDNRIVYLSRHISVVCQGIYVKISASKAICRQRPCRRGNFDVYQRTDIKKDADWLLRKIFTVKYIRYDWTLNEQP